MMFDKMPKRGIDSEDVIDLVSSAITRPAEKISQLLYLLKTGEIYVAKNTTIIIADFWGEYCAVCPG